MKGLPNESELARSLANGFLEERGSIVKRAKQLTVCLPNKPGMLARVCRVLAEAKLNIRAISVADATEACLVRVVADDSKAAAKALEAEGIQVTQTAVRVVELPNKVGALAEWAERMSKRKVNVNYVYGSAPAAGRKAILVVEANSS